MFVRNAVHFASRIYLRNLLLSPMKKISTGRITVITSPEDSSEFRREGKPNSTSSIQDRRAVARSFVLSNRERKNRVFRTGERTPCTFSRNSPKGHIKERKAEERKKGTAPLVFFNPQTLRSQSTPPWSLSFSFAWAITSLFFPRFFLIHGPMPPILSLLVYLLQPLVFRRYLPATFTSPRGILSPWISPPPLLFRFVLRRTARLRFRVFDYLVYFSRVLFSSVSVFLSLTVWKHAWFCKCL